MSYTGTSLVTEMMNRTGANVSLLARNALSSRSQQMIDAGQDSNQALAFVLMSNASFRESVDNIRVMLDAVSTTRETIDTRQTDVIVQDLMTYDASDRAFNFIFNDFDGTQFVNIRGFGDDDTITTTAWSEATEIEYIFDSPEPSILEFGIGNLPSVDPGWVVTLLDLDSELINTVLNAGSIHAQIGVLNDVWGEDWLNGQQPAPPDQQTAVIVANLDIYDATDGDYRFVFDTFQGQQNAGITGFGIGDTLDISAYDGTPGYVFTIEIDEPEEISFGFGNMDTFNPTWSVTLNGLDAALVADVVAAKGDGTDAQLAVLENAFGSDWLIV